MSTYETITEAQVDAKSPINEALMQGNETTDTGGVRHNFEALNDRLTAVEGGGSGGDSSDLSKYAKILSETKYLSNAARFWIRQFHTFQDMLTNNSDRVGFDADNTNKNDLSVFYVDREDNWRTSANASFYLGQALELQKDGKIGFILPKGSNFFGFKFEHGSGGCDSITMTIDGESITTAGLVDETGVAHADTFSTNFASIQFQRTTWFFGGKVTAVPFTIPLPAAISTLLSIDGLSVLNP